MASSWDKLSKAERHKRAAKLAKNPGDRSKIPTAFLRGFAGADKLRAERAKNERLDSPFVPGSPMTNRQATHEIRATVDQRYRAPEAELQRQVADSQRFEGQNLPGYFREYQRLLGEAKAQSDASTAAAIAQTQQLGKGLADASTAKQGEINQQMTADAAARGATYDQKTATDVAERASAARQALTSGFGAMIATQGANDRQRLIDAIPISQQRLGEEQATERGRRRTLTDKQLELAADKGDFANRVGTDIYDREQKGVLERAAFGLDEAKLRADIAAKTTAAREKQGEVNEYGYTESAWRKLSTGRRRQIINQAKSKPATAKDPKYGIDAAEWQRMTPEQRIQAKKRWESGGGKANEPDKEPASSLNMRRSILDRADGFLPKYAKDRGVQLNQSNRAKIVADLRRSHPGYFNGVQEIVLSASLDRAILGRISNANLRKLRNRGVFITSDGTYWGGGNR